MSKLCAACCAALLLISCGCGSREETVEVEDEQFREMVQQNQQREQQLHEESLRQMQEMQQRQEDQGGS